MAFPVLECIDFVSDVGGLAGLGWRWWALVGAPPPAPPRKAGPAPQGGGKGGVGGGLG